MEVNGMGKITMINVGGAHKPNEIATKILYVANGDGYAIAQAAGASAVNVLIRATTLLRKITGKPWKLTPEMVDETGEDGRTYTFIRCDVRAEQ